MNHVIHQTGDHTGDFDLVFCDECLIITVEITPLEGDEEIKHVSSKEPCHVCGKGVK